MNIPIVYALLSFDCVNLKEHQFWNQKITINHLSVHSLYSYCIWNLYWARMGTNASNSLQIFFPFLCTGLPRIFHQKKSQVKRKNNYIMLFLRQVQLTQLYIFNPRMPSDYCSLPGVVTSTTDDEINHLLRNPASLFISM